MKILIVLQILIHVLAWAKALFATGAFITAKGHILANMGAYLDSARRRVPAKFESYESLCNYESLDGPTLVNAVSKNPDLINQMPANILAHMSQGNYGAAANAMKGVPADPMGTTVVGGALNAKKNVAATFKILVSPPFVTVAGSGTAAPDVGQYNIPIFGNQVAQSNYSLPGILQGPTPGYIGQAISGQVLANSGGTLPAPFAAVAVDPTAWYFVYTNRTTTTLKAAMWVVTSNPKYPYTSLVSGTYGTTFHITRSRYILGNAAEQDQYGFAWDKGYQTTFGKIGSDTIDPDIFLSPEQLANNRADIDLDISITSRDYIVIPSDPVNVPSGFRIGFFVSNFAHQQRSGK